MVGKIDTVVDAGTSGKREVSYKFPLVEFTFPKVANVNVV